MRTDKPGALERLWLAAGSALSAVRGALRSPFGGKEPPQDRDSLDLDLDEDRPARPMDAGLSSESDVSPEPPMRAPFRLKRRPLIFIGAFIVVCGALLFMLIPRGAPKAGSEPASAEAGAGAAPAEAGADETAAQAPEAGEPPREEAVRFAPAADPEAAAARSAAAQGAAPEEEPQSAIGRAGSLTFQESPELPMGMIHFDAVDLGRRYSDAAVIRDGGSISQALEELGIPAAQASEAVKILDRENILRVVRPGAVIRAYYDSSEKLEGSLLRLELFQEGEVRPVVMVPGGPSGFIFYSTAGRALEMNVPSEVTVKDNFWSSGIDAGLEPRVIMSLADLLSSQIDFASGVGRGDNFQLLFRARYSDGELTGEPILDMVIVRNKDKTFEFFRQEFPDGAHDYFDENFRSVRKSFLASPLQFTRISSGYTSARMHPILKVVRPHLGVDYAAPSGTPVSAVADGEVSFSGSKGGYGLTVVIDHKASDLVTLYGHLSRIEKGIRKGTKVTQGQLIGYVGSTGLATGPHLDFRLRRGSGEYLNPEAEFARQEGKKLPENLQTAFHESIAPRKEKLRELLEWRTF